LFEYGIWGQSPVRTPGMDMQVNLHLGLIS
jgi:hypothetical protein